MTLPKGKTPETSGSERVSTKQRRIAELARGAPGMVLTTLAHHIDMDWMQEAWRRTRKDGAVGVDGQDAKEFAADLEGNLSRLLEAIRSGSYRAPPVRRVYIPKADGSQRPIGIPTFADKVAQRAVAMLLEAVYEQDFLDCSYGFRPGRSARQAVDAVQTQIKMWSSAGGGWVLEVDVKSFFDTLDFAHLRRILSQRVRDGVVERMIGKWLHAGVLESGAVTHPTQGTPQGGVISPMLSNIFLHTVVDIWFAQHVLPGLDGEARLVRYADDLVIMFRRKEDAVRVKELLSDRMQQYGLTLHPTKTRLVRFTNPHRWVRRPTPGGYPESFDFLGFTFYWGQGLQTRAYVGRWIVKTKTARKSLTRALSSVRTWIRRHRHRPVRWQWEELQKKVRGHYGYFQRPGNSPSLRCFVNEVIAAWRKWLGRRSHKAHGTWAWMRELLTRYPLMPPPTACLVAHA